ncbi:MAG: DNA polymerase III subunit chi [Gammaproteobacteria bacterium]
MTRIDFYITRNEETLGRELFTCRLAHKVFGLGQLLHIHADDETQLARLDELLWTFSDTSFLPHARLGAKPGAPITLDCVGAPEPAPELLINLAPDIPAFFSRFARLAEVIGADTASRETGRAHFRFYRDRGYALQVHNL